MNKQVQEIAADSHQLPERFLRKQDKEYGGVTDNGATSDCVTIAEVPVIDVSLLNSSSLELDKLKSAAATFGCFQAINHGIESSLIEKIRGNGRFFFNLSAEEKKKYLREEDGVEGYGNDKVLSDDQTIDWTDRLCLTVVPQEKRRLPFWPQNPTHFKEVLDEYSSKIEVINEVVLKSLARSLNLDENCFLKQYGTTGTLFARFNYYPPCPWPEKVLGLKPHGDRSAITVLLQDKEVEGLQILVDDQWVGVPIVHDALTITIGDQIEIMSNGIFKSSVHRVFVNPKSDRMALAMFCIPQTERDIGPVDDLITDETPRLYKNVTFSLDFFLKNYQNNRRAIDACKI